MTNFELALAFTLKMEGGFVDDPIDPGQATNRGITQRTYNSYLKEKGLDWDDVSNITNGQVEQIYLDDYWEAGDCNVMGKLLSIVHFDACVNVGVSQANKFLQRCLNCEPDGIIGPVTRHALARALQDTMVMMYLDYREKFYEQLCVKNEPLKRFLQGWKNRINDLVKYLTEVGP